MGDTHKKKGLLSSTMSLGDHLEDLRRRLAYSILGIIVGAAICLCFGAHIVKFIKSPYIIVTQKMGYEPNLQTLAPASGLTSYIKISLVSGLIVSSPWVFYHLWMFVAAGLYPREKKYVHFAAPFCALLFVGGAVFFIVAVAPLTLGFFLRFDRWFGVASNYTFPEYVSFIATLMLVFGIAFQTPVAIFFLNRTGLVSIQALKRSRKFVFLGVFVVAAFVTPPDPISQITLGIPLYLLFELGIILSHLASRKRKKT